MPSKPSPTFDPFIAEIARSTASLVLSAIKPELLRPEPQPVAPAPDELLNKQAVVATSRPTTTPSLRSTKFAPETKSPKAIFTSSGKSEPGRNISKLGRRPESRARPSAHGGLRVRTGSEAGPGAVRSSGPPTAPGCLVHQRREQAPSISPDDRHQGARSRGMAERGANMRHKAPAGKARSGHSTGRIRRGFARTPRSRRRDLSPAKQRRRRRRAGRPPPRFQQAKNPARGPQFLQIVAKPERAGRRGKPRRSPSRS